MFKFGFRFIFDDIAIDRIKVFQQFYIRLRFNMTLGISIGDVNCVSYQLLFFNIAMVCQMLTFTIKVSLICSSINKILYDSIIITYSISFSMYIYKCYVRYCVKRKNLLCHARFHIFWYLWRECYWDSYILQVLTKLHRIKYVP